MLTLTAIVAYATAMTLANLSILMFGPAMAPLNAVVLIGLDLALRDWLHLRLRPWQMACLIASSGVITYVLAPEAGRIAVASSVAFAAAAVADWVAFAALRGSWLRRANGSNVAGAAVDSIVFPVLAQIPLGYVPLMFAAKVAGGAAWAWALSRTQKWRKPEAA